MKTGLPRVIYPDTSVLILGSFPGEESLSKREYYANRRNKFWQLLSAALGENWQEPELDYKQRLLRLRAHRIGLWDVIAECEREGSSDAKIRNPRLNDFVSLRKDWPSLERICFNGKMNARVYSQRLKDAGFQTLALPSSSSAHARKGKAEVWRGILLGKSWPKLRCALPKCVANGECLQCRVSVAAHNAIHFGN